MIFGISLIVLASIILFHTNDFINKFFGTGYELQDNYLWYIPAVSLITAVIGGFLIYNVVRMKNIKEREKYCRDIITINRIRALPRTDTEVKKVAESWLLGFERFIENENFLALHSELESLMYRESKKVFDKYMRQIADLSKTLDRSEYSDRIVWGYPEFNLNQEVIQRQLSLSQYFSSSFPLHSIYFSILRRSLFNYPVFENLPLFEVLFSSKSEIIKRARRIQTKFNNLHSIDILFFRVTWFFLQAVKGKVKELIPLMQKDMAITKETGEEKVSLDTAMLTEELAETSNILYTLLFSTWVLKNFFTPSEDKMSIIYYYDRKKKEWSDYSFSKESLQNLERQEEKKYREIGQVQVKIKAEDRYVSEFMEKDIKDIDDVVKGERDWFGTGGLIAELPFPELLRLMDCGSYKEIIEKLRELRKETVETIIDDMLTLKTNLAAVTDHAIWK
ncbi:MAG: hypothetical protein ACFFD4_34455 [Candidatus Odinarchaeota archaeon]